MVALGGVLVAYGIVSARTGLPPQPETVAGPIFDQVAGVVVAVFAAAGLAISLRGRSRARRSSPVVVGSGRPRHRRPVPRPRGPAVPAPDRTARRSHGSRVRSGLPQRDPHATSAG
jgi:hypothetical protein